MSHGEGATIPLAFLTACYGLERLAKLRRGESVLIHAAAGGVGLAAIQAAKRAGGVIYATASSRKWDHLKSLGVETVLNSRTLDYADEIRALTGGRGVDVVLNSLTGEYIPKNLEILAPGGRFVEIGKIGIWDGAQVKRIRPDVCYHAFDLGDVACREPVLFRELFLEVMAGFEKGEFQPLKRTEFDLTEGERAFRYMAQAKQIGKVVLTRKIPGARVRSDGTYLITGGLGALGMETARWLASRGAKRIVLCGRGGGVSPSTAEKIDALERSGVGVSVFSADVAVREDVTRMMEALSGMPPLRGIVHAAGVLDDGVIGEQTWERFVRVMSPKIDGAWNLWEATRGMSLDFWVCYSSAASILGSPGQGNYAAANAFLDLLAHDLRRSGVRATTINWGPWALGMTAGIDHPGRKRIAAQGFRAIGPAEGFAVLERLLLAEVTQGCVLSVDWEAYFRHQFRGTSLPFFATLAGENIVLGDVGGGKSAVLQKLTCVPENQRRGILRDYVGTQVAAVLGERTADGIRPRQRLFDLGIDSLMAVELKNRLQSAFGIPLGATLVFDHPTVEALTDHLLEEWSVLNGPAPSSDGKSGRKRSNAGTAWGEETRGEEPDIGAHPGETDLDEASPEDVARMLAKELEAESET